MIKFTAMKKVTVDRFEQLQIAWDHTNNDIKESIIYMDHIRTNDLIHKIITNHGSKPISDTMRFVFASNMRRFGSYYGLGVALLN